MPLHGQLIPWYPKFDFLLEQALKHETYIGKKLPEFKIKWNNSSLQTIYVGNLNI